MNLPRRAMVSGLAALVPMTSASALQKSDPQLDRDAVSALQKLDAGNQAARLLATQARAILVFPKIVKVGLVLGGAYGKGVLRQNGRSIGYYNSAAASFGLQAGAQWFGYALYLMKDSAMQYLSKSEGWELGVGPSIVVVDKGMAGQLTTTTATQDVYAFIFNQKGLMAGLGIEGSKITRI